MIYIIYFPRHSHFIFFNLNTMNTMILNDISRNLLGAWYLDLRYLVDLLDENNIDFDDIIESIQFNCWEDVKLEINLIIYEVLTTIANEFISNNSKLFEDETDEFEIFTNYMDSHIYFKSDIVHNEFERFF